MWDNKDKLWNNIRIRATIYKKLAEQAKSENRSVANMLEVIIERFLIEQKE